jgi:hypothetical protein
MPFELQLILLAVVLPAVSLLAVVPALRWLGHRGFEPLAGWLLGFTWLVAIWLQQSLRIGQWWGAEEFWHTLCFGLAPLAILAPAIGPALLHRPSAAAAKPWGGPPSDTGGSGFGAPMLLGGGLALCLLLLAWISTPWGAGWEDWHPWLGLFLIGMTASGWLTFWSVERVWAAGGWRWAPLLAAIPLAAGTILAATAFGELAEWLLAVLVASGLMLTLTVWLGWQHHSHLWAWLPPVIVASFAPWIARLYQFQSIPVSVLALSSLGPLIVSLLDTAAVRRSWGGWARMMMAAGIASLFVAVILWQVVQATASHDEW